MAPQGNLLFVNKSASSQSLSRSHGTERSDIFSYVQQQSQQPPNTARGARNDGWAVETTVAFNLKCAPLPAKAGDLRSTNYRKQRKTTTRKPVCKLQEASVRQDVRLEVRSQALAASKLDPFECSIVPMDAHMTNLMKYYCHTMLNDLFPAKTWAKAILKYTIQYASDRPELLYALLCTASIVVCRETGDDSHVYTTMRWKGEAISHLKQNIEAMLCSGTTHSAGTLFAISFFIFGDVGMDINAALWHYKALQMMASEITPSNTTQLPLPVRVSVIVASFFCASHLKERPLLLPLFDSKQDDKDSEALLDYLSSDGESRATAKGSASLFFRPQNKSLVGPRLLNTITRLTSVEAMKERWAHQSQIPTREETEEIYSEEIAVEHDLLAMPSEPEEFTPAQHAIRLALLSCNAHSVIPAISRPVLVFTVAAQIQSNLKDWTCWCSAPDLLLWTLVIMAHVSDGGELYKWAVSKAMTVSNEIGIRSQKELENLLYGFLCPSRNFPDTVRKLWSDVDASSEKDQEYLNRKCITDMAQLNLRIDTDIDQNSSKPQPKMRDEQAIK